jgi:hypothetical protein
MTTRILLVPFRETVPVPVVSGFLKVTECDNTASDVHDCELVLTRAEYCIRYTESPLEVIQHPRQPGKWS